ncbi:MAG TPA: HET-C-related protein [Candidatus Obscuribacterales bacterium]
MNTAVRSVVLALAFPLCLFVPALSSSSQPATGASIHEEITREALKGTISDANLDFMIKAVISQEAPGSDGLAEPRRHFGDGNFAAAVAYMDREKKQALNYAADADKDGENRGQVLRHLGLMLHTAQDFYIHSNYVELQLEDPRRKQDPLGLELVEWARVPDGYVGKESGAALTAGWADTGKPPESSGSAGSAGGSRDNPGPSKGKKAAGGMTYLDIARELAVRETQRQWNLFEALVKGRFHERAGAIIAALKQEAISADASPDASPEIPEVD